MFAIIMSVFLFFTHSFSSCNEWVVSEFHRVGQKTRKFKVKSNKVIKSREYRNTIKGTFGSSSHFQSIRRHPIDKDIFYVTGGNFKTKIADLFILDIKKNKVISKVVLEKGSYWHAGGIGVSYPYISIPLEEYKIENRGLGKTIFLDISNPRDPVKLQSTLIGADRSILATDLIKEDDHYKLVNKTGKGLFLNSTKTLDLRDGFIESKVTFIPKKNIDSHIEDYDFNKSQNFNFFKKCGDQYYFIDYVGFFKNKMNLIRWEKGTDRLEVLFSRKMKCAGACRFRAGSGLNIENDKLQIFGIPLHRTILRKRVLFKAFY